jgi:glycosyltransferase involved in cell wall biosynthesis
MNSFSIVVAIYNIDIYLENCIMSLINQCSNKTEILLVDDGSTDKSREICQLYVQKYSNIKYYLKENGGLSDARNFGLLKATKKYVFFVDGDDYLPQNVLRMIDQKINDEYDIISANYRIVTPNKTSDMILNTSSVEFTGQEYLIDKLKINKYVSMVWRNIYNRAFLIKNQLFFEKNLLHEDEEWTPRVFLLASTVFSINDIIYNYQIRSNSISNYNNFESVKNSDHLIKTCYKNKDIFVDIKNKKLRKLLLNYVADLYLSAVFRGKLYDQKDILIHISFLKNNIYKIKTIIKFFILIMNRKLFDKLYYRAWSKSRY